MHLDFDSELFVFQYSMLTAGHYKPLYVECLSSGHGSM